MNDAFQKQDVSAGILYFTVRERCGLGEAIAATLTESYFADANLPFVVGGHLDCIRCLDVVLPVGLWKNYAGLMFSDIKGDFEACPDAAFDNSASGVSLSASLEIRPAKKRSREELIFRRGSASL